MKTKPVENVKSQGYTFSGRPKGAKDRKKRKTDGYYEREERKRQLAANQTSRPRK